MQTKPLLCVVALLWTGCLDWSTAPMPDAGGDVAPTDGGTDSDAEVPPCPDETRACAGRCGVVTITGCSAYECGACDDASVCTPTVSCESVRAQCGELDTGCGTVTCANQCGEGTACVDNACCEPEDPAVTCRGLCGGTAINRCGQEVSCDNPCGLSSNGCRDSEPPVAAVCFCPHAWQGETCEQSQILLRTPWDIEHDPRSGLAYVLDAGTRAIVRIDLETGARSVLSDDDDVGVARGAGPGFVTPRALVLDLSHGRAFVSDMGRDAILEVNLGNGNRRVLSDADDDDGARGEGPALVGPKGLALDLPRDRLLVVDSSDALHEVDLATGNRKVLSTSNAGAEVGTGPGLFIPQDIALDIDHGLAWVFCPDALFTVNLATGDRALVSSALNDAGLQRGAGPRFSAAFSGALDREAGRAFVLDLERDQVLAIDLESGDRTLVSGPDESGTTIRGAGPLFDSIRAVALLPDRNQLLALDEKLGFRVDLTTGDRTRVFDSGVGPGPGFDRPRGLALAPARGLAYVADRGSDALVRVELATGARTIVASAPDVFTQLEDVVLDVGGDAVYAVDSSVGLLRVDLATGERAVISDSTNPAFSALRMRAQSLVALDAARSRVVVAQAGEPWLLAVDLASGERTALSGATRGTGPALASPYGLALDPGQNKAYVVDYTQHAVYRVDLLTGNRVIVSGNTPERTLIGEGPVPYRMRGTALDAAASALYTYDANAGFVRVDLVNGARSPFGRGTGPSTGNVTLLALEPTGEFIYFTDDGLEAVARVQRSSGDRTVLSRVSY